MAERHERGNRAVRATPVPHRTTLVPPASGAEIIGILQREGYQAHIDGSGFATLVRGVTAPLRVPLVDRIRPELLVAIVRAAGVNVFSLLDYLDAHPSP